MKLPTKIYILRRLNPHMSHVRNIHSCYELVYVRKVETRSLPRFLMVYVSWRHMDSSYEQYDERFTDTSRRTYRWVYVWHESPWSCLQIDVGTTSWPSRSPTPKKWKTFFILLSTNWARKTSKAPRNVFSIVETEKKLFGFEKFKFFLFSQWISVQIDQQKQVNLLKILIFKKRVHRTQFSGFPLCRLFARSTVRCSLIVLKMSFSTAADTHKSCPSWVWSHNPPPPSHCWRSILYGTEDVTTHNFTLILSY